MEDMVVKTRRGRSHLEDLRETFSILTEYGLKLNPIKCTFGVKFRKFLGFMMLEHDIEANPRKIEAVMALAKPRCVKDIHRLNGCIAALGRFVSKSAERCMPFFKVLKLSGKTFQWDESCMKAWKSLKSYLANLPLLRAPTPDEVLYMYLLVSQQAVALHLPIYFVS